jgi:NitT/TauT family transport system ATP-binding protein
MRQRVGFARAIVSDSVLLLMDEPFSALDVLTAETLRTDFLDLWVEDQLPTEAVLMVTHIEEAVLMCDRILVLASNPGHIATEIAVRLTQPPNRLDAAFHDIVDEVYSILTSRMTESIRTQARVHGGLVQIPPQASPNRIGGFAETLASPAYGGHADLAERKRLFREHLIRFVPLAAHIRHVLDEREEDRAPRGRFEFELQDHLNQGDAESTLRVTIGWGRYAELFSYDDETRMFSLDHAAAGASTH